MNTSIPFDENARRSSTRIRGKQTPISTTDSSIMLGSSEDDEQRHPVTLKNKLSITRKQKDRYSVASSDYQHNISRKKYRYDSCDIFDQAFESANSMSAVFPNLTPGNSPESKKNSLTSLHNSSGFTEQMIALKPNSVETKSPTGMCFTPSSSHQIVYSSKKSLTYDYGEDDAGILPNTQPIDDRILKDVVAYVEVRYKADNRSRGIQKQMEALGAKVVSKFTNDVTHVIFKDGRKSTKDKALKKGIHLVSVLWIESCKKNQKHVSETHFPATLTEDDSPLCIGKLRKMKSMQPKDFDEDLAQSAEKCIRRRKRIQTLNQWKLLNESSPDLASGSFYVAETQDIASSPIRLLTTPLAIPVTPPSMQAKLDILNREKAKTDSIVSSKAQPPDSPISRGSQMVEQKILFQNIAQSKGDQLSSLSKSKDTLRSKLIHNLHKRRLLSFQKGTPPILMAPNESLNVENTMPKKNEQLNKTEDLNKVSSENQNIVNVVDRKKVIKDSEKVPEYSEKENNFNEINCLEKKEKLLNHSSIKIKAEFQNLTKMKDIPNASNHASSKKFQKRNRKKNLKSEETNEGNHLERNRLFEDNITSKEHSKPKKLNNKKKSQKRNYLEFNSDLGSDITKSLTCSEGQLLEKSNCLQSTVSGRNSLEDFKSLNKLKRKSSSLDSLISQTSDCSIGTRNNKKSNRQRFTQSLVTTSVHSKEQDVIYAVVKKLGDFYISNSVCDTTTHVICGNNRRTLNIIEAIIRGCWILSIEWVLKSLEAGKWLEEEPYEQYEYFPSAQVCRLEKFASGDGYKCSLFSNEGSIFVADNSSPPREKLINLIELSGGTVTTCLRKASLCIGIVTRQEKLCLSEKWILDSITEQQSLIKDDYLLKEIKREASPEY